jgi:hypothetical protein
MRLLHPIHASFFADIAGPTYQTLDFTPAQQAQSKATAYFKARPIHVIQATGTDTAHDLNITFQIALDPQASLIFTFITALTD